MTEQTLTAPRSRRIDWTQSGIYLAFAGLVIILAIISPTFRTVDNMTDIARAAVFLAIGAFAMTFVILLGEIDLSIGAVASLAGVVAALQLSQGASLVQAILAAVLTGLIMGLLNGLVIVYGRVASFIVTLATFYVAQGLSLSLTNGQTITFSNHQFQEIFALGSIAGIPTPVALVVALFIVLWWLLQRTPFGQDVYAIGGNRTSARMLGLPVNRTRIAVFAMAGLLMGIAALGLIARIGNARSDGGIGLEFDAIAAVVIGGTSFSGGRGSLGRTVIGVLFISVINNGLALMNVNFNVQQVVKGIIVVLAVVLDQWARRRAERRLR
jgi:ribose transport system permease protein